MAEARLLLAIQGQMPLIRMLRARLAERRSTWDTSMLTIKILSCGACSAEGMGAKVGLVGVVRFTGERSFQQSHRK